MPDEAEQFGIRLLVMVPGGRKVWLPGRRSEADLRLVWNRDAAACGL